MSATQRFCLSTVAGILAFVILTETGAVEPYLRGWHVDGIDALVITQILAWFILLRRREA